MSALLWVIVLTPFAGALVLALFGASLPKKAAGVIGCASVGISWICALIVGWQFIPGGAIAMRSVSIGWMDVGWLHVTIGLRLDALSLVWLEIVTFVGFLIHLYASQSMYEEDGYSRFFCYMNLFVGSMLTLVLADNLLLLYLGWEGVGLCSYLLIGFWYKDRANCDAARKAFIVTRVGDTALAIALFILARQYHTLDIQTILHTAPAAAATLTAFLILAGAVGKSAQLPLQTWLPDAMAGPTPVSALIHAATMVTAGVYLIARLHVLFTLAPIAQLAVAVIGAVTLLYAGVSAITQHDIKRVLAYSTMSQIGYMFLALGLGAWTAAVFHFITHAFFKALLFLSAGIVIDALGGEHDLFRMGGLRRRLPVAFWTFLIGAASLSSLPLVTAGFYSKHEILYAAWTARSGSIIFYLAALIGALITSAYSFRALFLAFCGEPNSEPVRWPGALEKLVVMVLAFFAIVAGFMGMPESLGGFNPFGRFMSSVFAPQPLLPMKSGPVFHWVLILTSSAACLAGILIAYVYFAKPALSAKAQRVPILRAAHAFFFAGWGFDWLYEHLFVIPLKAIARANRADIIDAFFTGVAHVARSGGYVCGLLQTGRVRNYAAALVFGAIVVTLLALFR
jgi:NADH-quinone oxidoreductase subunit L